MRVEKTDCDYCIAILTFSDDLDVSNGRATRARAALILVSAVSLDTTHVDAANKPALAVWLELLACVFSANKSCNLKV